MQEYPSSRGKGHRKGERQMLYNLIEEDEVLEDVIGGLFGPDLGQSKLRKTPHKGIAVATNRRVLMVDKGLFGSTEVAEIGYENIEAITHSTGMIAGGLRITGRGTASFRIEMVVPKEAAKLFADCVRGKMREWEASKKDASTIVATGPGISLGDEIEKLANLMERGFLTKGEFETKKK